MKYIVQTNLEINNNIVGYAETIDAEDEAMAYSKAKANVELEYNQKVKFPDRNCCNIQLQEQIVMSDSDTDKMEDDSNPNGLYPYDPSYTSIDIEELPFSIFEYLRQLNKGRIIINPEFQRNQVWKQEQKSKFIESVILNFPLPPIYLNQNKENKYIVIDGLQRTTALSEYFDDKFALSSLEAIPPYNGKRFSDLSETLQSKLENKKLTIFSLKPSTPLVVIYDLFKRINTGGTQLNRQEIRNCIFIGKSTRLLKKLASMEIFRSVTDYGVSPKRMKDREVVLRYLSFRWGNPNVNYEGDMSRFLEGVMAEINKMQETQIKEIEDDFVRVMNWVRKIWGSRCFRIPTDKTRGVVNMAVFESVCKFISLCTDDFLTVNRDDICSRYEVLITNNAYREAVTRTTASKSSVANRFRLAHDILSSSEYNNPNALW